MTPTRIMTTSDRRTDSAGQGRRCGTFGTGRSELRLFRARRRAGEAEAMNARHLHPSARKNTAAVRRDPGAATPAASPADIPGRACCCPAKVAVRVIMPPARAGPARPTCCSAIITTSSRAGPCPGPAPSCANCPGRRPTSRRGSARLRDRHARLRQGHHDHRRGDGPAGHPVPGDRGHVPRAPGQRFPGHRRGRHGDRRRVRVRPARAGGRAAPPRAPRGLARRPRAT